MSGGVTRGRIEGYSVHGGVARGSPHANDARTRTHFDVGHGTFGSTTSPSSPYPGVSYECLTINYTNASSGLQVPPMEQSCRAEDYAWTGEATTVQLIREIVGFREHHALGVAGSEIACAWGHLGHRLHGALHKRRELLSQPDQPQAYMLASCLLRDHQLNALVGQRELHLTQPDTVKPLEDIARVETGTEPVGPGAGEGHGALLLDLLRLGAALSPRER